MRGSSRLLRLLAAVAVAVGLAVVVQITVLRDADDALVVMGFDPDRARLIDSLVVAFLAAVLARLVSNGFRASIAAGLAAFGVLFGGTFAAETRAALTAHGTFGSFDPSGWLLTAATLLVVAGLVSVAASSLGGDVRAFLLLAGRDGRTVIRERHPTARRLGRPVAVVLAIAALAVAGPVFGDMVNYTPDMHMRDGSVVVPGLVGAAGDGAGYVPVGKRVGAATGGVPTGSVGLPSVTTSTGAIAVVAPWLAWRPAGSGKVIRTAFPAPWVDGTSTTANVMVVEPPGYDTSPGRRYPVVYEAPNGAGGWAPQIDSFFTTGEAPAELMVYIQSGGGPFADSECVNSADGREQFERFVVQTVVPWVDRQFRTIASPAGRTIEGASQGGYCAPMLLLRHPDVFGQGIALSGYYTAGIRSAETVNAALPFGGNAALMQAYSPSDIAPRLAAPIRSRIYLVLAGDPSQPFFGPQLQSFASELDRLGIAHSVIDDDLGHTWIGFERDLPIALRLVGLRQASLGLFGG